MIFTIKLNLTDYIYLYIYTYNIYLLQLHIYNIYTHTQYLSADALKLQHMQVNSSETSVLREKVKRQSILKQNHPQPPRFKADTVANVQWQIHCTKRPSHLRMFSRTTSISPQSISITDILKKQTHSITTYTGNSIQLPNISKFFKFPMANTIIYENWSNYQK